MDGRWILRQVCCPQSWGGIRCAVKRSFWADWPWATQKHPEEAASDSSGRLPTARDGHSHTCQPDLLSREVCCLPAETLWVRITEQTGMGDKVVGVCCGTPEQEEQVGEAFYGQLEAASPLQALVLMGHFNHPDICWRGNREGHKQSRRFVESIDDTSGRGAREVFCWTSYSPTRRVLSWMWRSTAALAAVTIKRWSSESWVDRGGEKAGLQDSGLWSLQISAWKSPTG